MARLRSVNVQFWDDGYVRKLKVDEKLVFLYLITSPLANLAGVYELSLDHICFHTGISEKRIIDIMQKFTKDEKLLHVEGYVILRNQGKHRKVNASMQINIDKTIAELPDLLKVKYNEALEFWNTACIQGGDSLSTECVQVKGKVKVKVKEKGVRSQTVQERLKKFEKDVYDNAKEKGFSAAMLKAFINYWTEPNALGTRMRFELQPTFQIGRRLGTWASREFSRGNGKPDKRKYDGEL